MIVSSAYAKRASALTPTAKTDRAAVALSFACIAHCLALPMLAFALPVAGVLAEAELVHWVLGALAIAASISIPLRSRNARNASFLVPAAIGSVLIAIALFAEPFGLDDTTLTVLGGVFLSASHLRRLLSVSSR